MDHEELARKAAEALGWTRYPKEAVKKWDDFHCDHFGHDRWRGDPEREVWKLIGQDGNFVTDFDGPPTFILTNSHYGWAMVRRLLKLLKSTKGIKDVTLFLDLCSQYTEVTTEVAGTIATEISAPENHDLVALATVLVKVYENKGEVK